jgi:hypothetical protein
LSIRWKGKILVDETTKAALANVVRQHYQRHPQTCVASSAEIPQPSTTIANRHFNISLKKGDRHNRFQFDKDGLLARTARMD